MFGPVIRGVLALAFVVFAVSLSPFAEAAQAPRVTIQELKKNWKRYDGKTVQVHGQFDACNDTFGAGCVLCPEEMTDFDWNHCLSLSFLRESALQEPSALFASTSLMRELYRFATVTIEARLDSTSLYDENGDAVKPELANAISDGGYPNLAEARVLHVDSRKTARNGLVSGESDQISAVIPQERDAMMTAFAAVYPDEGIFKREVFAVQLSRSSIERRQTGDPYIADGIACVNVSRQTETVWPTRWFMGMKSPANPFRCWGMQKREGAWRVLVDEY